MIHITLKLLGPFRSFAEEADADGAQILALEPGARLSEALQCAALPEEVPRVVLVNGVQCGDDPRLAEGDLVTVFPPIAGGCRGDVCWN